MSNTKNDSDIPEYDGGNDSDTESDSDNDSNGVNQFDENVEEVSDESDESDESDGDKEAPVKSNKTGGGLYDNEKNFYDNYDVKQNKLIKNITKYEYTTVISLRAEQLSNNAPSFLTQTEIDELDTLKMLDAISIAKKEFELKKIPFIIKRPISDNNYEGWKLADLK